MPAPCSPTSHEPGGRWAVGTSLPPPSPGGLSPVPSGVHTIPRATCTRGCVPQQWGGGGCHSPGSHSISAPQGHGPSSCLARLSVSRGEPGSGAASTTSTRCQSQAGPSRALRCPLPWHRATSPATAGDTAQDTAVVTPEDTGLHLRSLFLQGAGVSLPPTAPPRPVPFPEQRGRREKGTGAVPAPHGELCLSPLILPFPLVLGQVLVLSALEVPCLGRG